MASRPVSVTDRARGRVAPAAGCFGLRQRLGDDDAFPHAPVETSNCERFAERFAMIDYGDGQAPVRKALRTS